MASFLEDFQKALDQQKENQTGDPWRDDDKEQLFSHYTLFSSVINIISKTYSFRFDEAMRNIPANALAMRRDAYIQSLLQERIFPTVHRTWDIEVEEPKDPNQQRVSKTLKKAIKKIPRFEMMLSYLLEAIWYGRYGSKIYWEETTVGGVPFWIPTKHRPVNGDKIQTRFDDKHSDFLPVIFVNPTYLNRYPRESIVFTDRVPGIILDKPEWRNQFIIHRNQINDADYFEVELSGGIGGIGVRNYIYWAWWLRDELLSWCIDYMQKVGTLGLLVFWYESGNKEGKAKAEENARKANRSTALTMPVPAGKDGKTWGVEQLQAGTAGIQALQHMIMEYFERHMERLIVGQTLSSNSEGSGLGGTGVASLHADTKFNILKFDALNLGNTLTEDLVNPIIGANRAILGEIDFDCRFRFNVEKPENEKKLEGVDRAVSMGVTFKMDDVRDLTGMEKPEEGDEIVGGPQAQPNPMDPNNPNGNMDPTGQQTDILDQLLELKEKLEQYMLSHPQPIHESKVAHNPQNTGQMTGGVDTSSVLPKELEGKVKGVFHGLRERMGPIKDRLRYFATNTLENLYQDKDAIHSHAEQMGNELWKSHHDKIFQHTGISEKDAWLITKLLVKKAGKSRDSSAHQIAKVKEGLSQPQQYLADAILELYERQRAPVGGVWMAGRHYKGGQFLPKGEGGSGSTTGSNSGTKTEGWQKPKVQDTIAKIKDIQQSRYSHDEIKAFAQSLAGHTVQEINEIKKALGIKASGAKLQLAKKIAERALKNPQAKEEQVKSNLPSIPEEERLDNRGKVQFKNERAEKIWKETMGDIPLDRLPSLLGMNDGESSLEVSKEGNAVQINVSNPRYDALRYFEKRGEELVCKNYSIEVKPEYREKGLGSEIFTNQVRELQKNGFSYIEADLSRAEGMNGYYTWPRLGYDAPLSSALSEYGDEEDFAKDIRKLFPGTETILDLMSTQEGREWWKKNGVSIDKGRFDLTSGSRSLQVLEAYQKEKGRK